MPDIRVQDEQGNVHVFPDGSTPDMIAKAMNVRLQGQPPPEQQPTGILNTLGQAAIGAGKGALRSVYNMGAVQGPPYLQGSGLPVNQSPPPQSIQPTNTAQRVGGYAETGAELVAPFLGAGRAAVSAADALPSFGKAKPVFEELKNSIGNIPINMDEPLRLAQEAKGMMGHNVPKAVNDIIKTLTPTEKSFIGRGSSSIPIRNTPDPINYNQARDLYSALSELSTGDKMNMTGPMLHKMREIASAVDDSIRSSIPSMSQSQKYAAAMEEYAKAGTLGRQIEILKKYGLPIAAGALGVGGVLKGLNVGSKLLGQ